MELVEAPWILDPMVLEINIDGGLPGLRNN